MCINLTLGLFEQLYRLCVKKNPVSCCSILVLVTRKEVCDLCNYDPSQEHITYAWHDGTTVISRQYKLRLSGTCSLQVYYMAYSDNSVPTFQGGITTVSCVISQKSADLMYICEAWNHKRFSDFSFSWRSSLLFLVIFFTWFWRCCCVATVGACIAHGVYSWKRIDSYLNL